MKRKLIEVALPLEAINRESAREKSIRFGHPSTLHLWWARRPLAACRAMLFASLVDDPSSRPEEFPDEPAQDAERERLFRLLEELVRWEGTTDDDLLARAHAEILRSTDGEPPPVLDPFAGGGSIPLEAQRLGLKAFASDLNPIPVLINKALLEIPARYADQPPVRPDDGSHLMERRWRGAQGLAEDVRYYGAWMRDEAERRAGSLYPKVDSADGDGTVLAWLWARTVTCPNPACGSRMPLIRGFWLGRKSGKETWVEPVVEDRQVRFHIRSGTGGPPDGTVGRTGARCLVCSQAVPLSYIREEGKSGRIGTQLMAEVTGGDRRRIYWPPIPEHEAAANLPAPGETPVTDLPHQALGFRVQGYGMTQHSDLFTTRQLTILTTLAGLIAEARAKVLEDARSAARPEPGEYADAVATYLSFVTSRVADCGSNLCTWRSDKTQEKAGHVFSRQAISMVWDFAEANPFGPSSGNITDAIEWVTRVVERLGRGPQASVRQLDATHVTSPNGKVLVSTDPPYYDNVGYADLSDFFYVWLRLSLSKIYPDLFATVLTPKADELIADPFRYGGREKAKQHFEHGFRETCLRLRDIHDDRYPLTVYYAFKQAETDIAEGSTASTGWETMLEGLMFCGLSVTGTWPIRSELGNRTRSRDSNALASSVVLVCRVRPTSAPLATRKDFIAALKQELPDSLRALQRGNIAPVDLAQASIGPGMAIFSRFSRVVEADGSRMGVRAALGLINQVLDELLAEQESDFDRETRWAIAWFEQYGINSGPYGEAETLSRAKNTAVAGLVDAGVIVSRAGKVRLNDRDELEADWDPSVDQRLTVWEVVQHLIRTLDQRGEASAAVLLGRLGGLGGAARELAYRLFNICERKGWAREALAYNTLVVAWPVLVDLAASTDTDATAQPSLEI